MTSESWMFGPDSLQEKALRGVNRTCGFYTHSAQPELTRGGAK